MTKKLEGSLKIKMPRTNRDQILARSRVTLKPGKILLSSGKSLARASGARALQNAELIVKFYHDGEDYNSSHAGNNRIIRVLLKTPLFTGYIKRFDYSCFNESERTNAKERAEEEYNQILGKIRSGRYEIKISPKINVDIEI